LERTYVEDDKSDHMDVGGPTKRLSHKDRQDARNMLLAIPGAQELFEKETPNDSPSVEPLELH